ncbi:MAG: tetraacyldisaccharide 4'-kinase [Alphaproteobacteria bacterium]
MRAPDFWRFGRDSGIARLLEPVGLAYAAVGAWRLAHARPERAAVPVVCVGNLVAGGAGKTPVALALARRLRDRGLAPWFLTRGHGGREAGPLRVDSFRHSADEVGDEALLLAAVAPTVVSRRRPAGAALAAAGGAGVVIMDDGHQNPTLVKNMSLVVVDGGYGFGNGRILPAGPLREPVARGLARASAMVVIGDDETDIAAWTPPGLPLLTARMAPGPEAAALAGRRVVAFAGIGRPEKFFAMARAVGAEVVAEHPFADHYPYAEADIQPILDEAFALSAIPLTTAKDAVRLPPDQRQQVTVLTVSVTWDDPAALDRLLDDHLQDGGIGHG